MRANLAARISMHGFSVSTEAILFHNWKNTIGDGLHNTFLFGHYFRPFEAEIGPSMTRRLNRGTDFDAISVFDFRIANNRSTTNTQHCYRDGRLIVLKTE